MYGSVDSTHDKIQSPRVFWETAVLTKALVVIGIRMDLLFSPQQKPRGLLLPASEWEQIRQPSLALLLLLLLLLLGNGRVYDGVIFSTSPY